MPKITSPLCDVNIVLSVVWTGRPREVCVSPSHKHRGSPFPPLLRLQVGTCLNEDADSLRRTVRDLLAKLQEADWQHQSDRAAFEVRFGIRGEGTPRVGLLDAGASDLLGIFLAGCHRLERLRCVVPGALPSALASAGPLQVLSSKASP